MPISNRGSVVGGPGVTASGAACVPSMSRSSFSRIVLLSEEDCSDGGSVAVLSFSAIVAMVALKYFVKTATSRPWEVRLKYTMRAFGLTKKYHREMGYYYSSQLSNVNG